MARQHIPLLPEVVQHLEGGFFRTFAEQLLPVLAEVPLVKVVSQCCVGRKMACMQSHSHGPETQWAYTNSCSWCEKSVIAQQAGWLRRSLKQRVRHGDACVWQRWMLLELDLLNSRER